MKYPQIFDYVNTSDSLTFMPSKYPEYVFMPRTGHVVPDASSSPLHATEDDFDGMIDRLLTCDIGEDDLYIIYHDDNGFVCSKAMLFQNRHYAMGYAHGTGHNAVYHPYSGIRYYRS